MKKYKLFNDTYHQTFYFLPGVTEEDYERAIRTVEPKYSVNLTRSDGHTSHYGGIVFIWLKGDKLEHLGSLVHECIHAANFCLSDRGIKQDTENDEALTYLAQWIYEKCLKHMRVK